MKSAYFTIHPSKKSSSSKCLPVGIRFCIFFKAPVSHPHFPHSTGLSTKPTGRHYTKYRFSPDMGPVGLGKDT
jgi:hypothetical protein